MNTYNIRETASRIRNLRKIHRYTQEQAAELLGIDRRTLGNIETAQKGCSVDLFIRITELYKVSLDYLLLGKDIDRGNLKTNLEHIIQELSDLQDTL